MKVLGIETSCDETGVALVSTQDGLLAHCLHTQIAMHAPYGGVVPELASRDHVRKVIPLVEQCLEQAEVERAELDAIAYTAGPGLMGALLVGASAAQGLAWSLGIPSVPIHHMEAHLLAPMLDETVELNFPFVAMLVSGGHTLLLEARALGDYEILGQSVDDAVGEAFDKTAKILDLGYPGGPKIEKLAKQGREERYTFPRPMLDRPGLNFSFSGLKTHALTTFRDSEQTDRDRADVALAFQTASIDVLTQKCMRALEQTGNSTLVVAGGVSANTHLRENLQSAAREHGAKVIFPKAEFCTDNGAMIAYAGSLYLETQASSDYKIRVRPRWPMSESLQAS